MIGQWESATELWQLLDPMGRTWSRNAYRPGYAEYRYALFCFYQGNLTEAYLAQIEELVRQGKGRLLIRWLHSLCGEWSLERGDSEAAAKSLRIAVLMAREVGQSDANAETGLAVAQLHLGQLDDARREAERLTSAKERANRLLAELWVLVRDREQATKHALAAYKWAWADGEPYVRRYELNKATELLDRLGVEIPKLPPYDPEKAEKIPCEDEVIAFIEKLKREKADKEAAKKTPE